MFGENRKIYILKGEVKHFAQVVSCYWYCKCDVSYDYVNVYVHVWITTFSKTQSRWAMWPVGLLSTEPNILVCAKMIRPPRDDKKSLSVWSSRHHRKSQRWLSGRAFSSHAENRGSIPGRNKPKSLKQKVIAPLPSARRQVQVSWILGDDHHKRMPPATVGVARWNGHECRVKPFTTSRVEHNTTNKKPHIIWNSRKNDWYHINNYKHTIQSH